MSLETFFDNFAVLANAPNGVAKLRKLILQLAVRGKLVPQNPSEVPASVLREKIAQEKASRSNGTKVESTKENSVEQTAALYSLPPGWVWARFGDVTINRDGERIPVEKSLRQGRHGIYDYYGASGVIDKIDNYLFDRPLLLIGEDGANLINRSTPIAFIAKGKYWVNNHAHVLDSVSVECLEYLEIFVNATDLRPYITGTAQPKMNQAKMNSIPVALAPEEEQKRIVSKVDELMQVCDQLEARQQAKRESRVRLNASILAPLNNAAALAPEELEQATTRLADNFELLYDSIDTVSKLRATILQLAVQGKLVAQDPMDEPASKLLDQIKKTRDKSDNGKKGKNTDRLPAIEDDATPFILPSGWRWSRFADVATIASNLVQPWDYLDYPHVAPDNIEKFTGRLLPYRTVRDDKVSSPNHKFFEGQIVYSKIRPNLAKAIIVDFEGLCSADMYPINSHIYTPFLLHYMLSETFLSMAVKTDTRVAMPKINREEMNRILVPVPPLTEQKRIVVRVEKLMSLSALLEAKLRQAEADSEKLMNAAVKHVLDSVRNPSKTAEEVFA